MKDFLGLPFWVGLLLGWLVLGRVVTALRSKLAAA